MSTTALSRFFHLEERGSSVATELRGGLATFLTMAYILVANAQILAAAGVPLGAGIASTALASGICCILMGLLANSPIALASGMGINAMVAFEIAPATGSWQTAMGLVILNGVIIFVLVVAGLREAVMYAVPRDMRRAIGAGIGFFIAFIGAVNARIVVVPGGTLFTLAKNPEATMPPVGFGSLANPETAVAVAGLAVTAFLLARRVKGAIVIGIVVTTAIAIVAGIAAMPKGFAAPDFSAVLKADIPGALFTEGDALRRGALGLLLALLMVDFFDTLGTATAVSEQAGIVDENGRIPRLRNLLLVDSASAAIGGALGASSVTSYIESAAGVAEGARTGLHTVFVGVLFLLAIFLAPLAAAVPACATAPALILVGFLMCSQIAKIDFEKYDTAIPAFVTLVTLPVTYSIAHGIGFGFITYVAIQVLRLRLRAVHPVMYGVTLAFVAYFIWG